VAGDEAVKLGKAPATVDHRDLKFAEYVDFLKVPIPPVNFGHETTIGQRSWAMLGNDQYGDCVFAGACHEHMLWTAEVTGKPTLFTDNSALAAYGAVTGFRPDDPSSDQGTNVRDALSYRQKTGIKDAHGTRHKIGAYVALEPGNLAHLFVATYLFGAVGVGLRFPSYAMDQFGAGKAWDVVKGQPEPTEGHYVPVVAKRGGKLTAVTWGQTQTITQAFYTAYCDEAWAFIAPDHLHKLKSPEGFNMAQLTADLAAVKR
jgi:hypothetical protein